MRSLIIVAACASIAVFTGQAQADRLQTLIEPVDATVHAPVWAPRAFTPAPVPNVDSGMVTPADRAGGPFDAGPANATPFSGELATVPMGTQGDRAERGANSQNTPYPTGLWRY